MRTARQASFGTLVFLLLLVCFSVPIDWLILKNKHMTPGLTVLLMWSPGLAALLTRLIRWEGLADVSFRLGGGRGAKALLLAWLFPLGVGVCAYGSGWLLGAGHFSGTPVAFAQRLLLAMTLALIDGGIMALGEELGWRGYLLPRFCEARIPMPILLTSLIWAVWHYPLIWAGVYGQQGSLTVLLPLFTVSCIAAGFVTARLRLWSGSIWPAVLFHATWNSVIQLAFDAFTVPKNLWLGESGILVAVFSATGAFLLCRPGGLLFATDHSAQRTESPKNPS
jgi:membrane protease YdiL (CAAX protease family)